MDQGKTDMTFGHMKTVLGGALSRSDCQSICAYFNMTKAKTDTIMNASWPGLQLLDVLSENDDILENDVTKLETALRDLHLGKAANIALAYQERFGK